MNVSFITAYSPDKNIGGEYNRLIEKIDDDWIFIRDRDCMFLTPDYGTLIENIIKANKNRFDIIGAVTNRLNKDTTDQVITSMFDIGDISLHIQDADFWKTQMRTIVKPTDKRIAGMCMFFKRKVWEQIHFTENTPFFDSVFCEKAKQKGYRLGVACGLYVFHLYRWGQKDPENYYNHLK